MKKIIIAFTLLTVAVFAACNSGSSSEKKDTTATTSTSDTSKMISAVKYTCKMHPEVISDTPGKCPKCGMGMVPIQDTSMNKMNMDTMKH